MAGIFFGIKTKRMILVQLIKFFVMLPISQWAKSVGLSSILGCTKVLLTMR